MPNSLTSGIREILAKQGRVFDGTDDDLTTALGALQRKELFEQFPDFNEEYQAIREANSPGTLGGLKNTARTAFDRSRQSLNAVGGVDAEDVASIERDIQERPSSVPWEDWQRAQSTGESWQVFKRDPIEIMSNIITSGFAGSVPAMAGGLSLGAAGAAVGGPAAPVTGLLGAAAGTFAGSMSVEYGSKYLDVLRDMGADLTDPDSIRAVLENPETRAKARGLAYRRSIPVAVFDAASAGLAGKFAKGLRGASTGTIARKGAAEAVMQGGLGGGGEVAGAMAAGEQINPKAVFEEVVGEIGPGAVETAGAVMRRRMTDSGAGPTPSNPGPITNPIPLPADPAVPTVQLGATIPLPGRSTADIVQATEAMSDEQAMARVDELLNKEFRLKLPLAPEEQTELDILWARVGADRTAETAPVVPPAEPTTIVPTPTDETIIPPPTAPAAVVPGVAAVPADEVAAPAADAVVPVTETAIATSPERITSAAARTADGTIYTGKWHPAAYEEYMNATGLTREQIVSQLEDGSLVDGFVTSTGRFVTREEAAEVATKANQFKPNKDGDVAFAGGLKGMESGPGKIVAPVAAPVVETPIVPSPEPPAAVATEITPSQVPMGEAGAPVQASPAGIESVAGAAVMDSSGKIHRGQIHALIEGFGEAGSRDGYVTNTGRFITREEADSMARDIIPMRVRGDLNASEIDDPIRREAYLEAEIAQATSESLIQDFREQLKRTRDEIAKLGYVREGDRYVFKAVEPVVEPTAPEVAQPTHVMPDGTVMAGAAMGAVGEQPAQMTHRAFIASGKTEAEWDTYAAEQNAMSRAKRQAALVESWRTSKANGNDIANLLRGRGVTIPDSISNALQHNDTTVSATEVAGRGMKRPEAAKIHRWVSEQMNREFPTPAAPVIAPLPYGTISAGNLSLDFGGIEGYKNLAPERWAELVLRYIKPKKEDGAAVKGAVKGDASGAKGVTRIGMALLDTDGQVIFAGVTTPQQVAAVGGKTERLAPVALQRMGTGSKVRAVKVGGEQPLLLRDAVAHGFKPIAVRQFTGEPTAIFKVFPNLAAFEAALSATPKVEATPLQAANDAKKGAVTPAKPGQQFRTVAQINAEISAVGDRIIASKDAQETERLSKQVVKLYEDLQKAEQAQLTRETSRNVPLGDVELQTVPQVDPSRAAIEAVRTQEFIALLNRLQAVGGNVELLTREFFQQGVTAEIERQIAQLQQQLAQAQGGQRAVIERQLAHRQARLQEVGDGLAQGATFSPHHIALAVDNVQAANLNNLVTLLHEAAEAQALGLTPMMKGAISRAIAKNLTDIRAKTKEAGARSGADIANETGLFDALSESLAQQLAAEGVPDAPSLAKAIWRWVKEIYYRAAMALQRSFGQEPSAELALNWFENQLRRVVGGDYDYRLGSFVEQYLPEAMDERVLRFQGLSGTPGGVVDFYNPLTGKIEQPGVLPLTAEAFGWNVEFQTLAPQKVKGEDIASPEANARIGVAALRKYAERLEKARVASGTDVAWGNWWKTLGTGEDPRVLVAAAEAKDASLASATIGGARMNATMNGLAAQRYRELVERFEMKAQANLAKAQAQVDLESAAVVTGSKEINVMEGDRRNADVHEGMLQTKLKKIIAHFVDDNSLGYQKAQEKGELAAAVRQAERLLSEEPIPEVYQNVFKAVQDGEVRVYEYVREIAKLELDLKNMTQSEVVKAIRDFALTNDTLRNLTQNKPLLVALAVMARSSSGHFDEISLGAVNDKGRYNEIHTELETIRKSGREQLREMILNMKEQVKGAGLTERIKRDYLNRRRSLQGARSRVALAQGRLDLAAAAMPEIAGAVEEAQQEGGTAPAEWHIAQDAEFLEMHRTEDGGWKGRTRKLKFKGDGTLEDVGAVEDAYRTNLNWLHEHDAKKGGALYERVSKQTKELAMHDFRQQYTAAQRFKFSTFFAPLGDEAKLLGAGGERLAKRLNFFQHILFTETQEVIVNSASWQVQWDALQKATGIKDNGIFQKQIYDPVLYFLNTEPGLDEDAAIRHATKLARSRLTKEPAANFNASFEAFLRATKKGFEHLLSVAEKHGSFVLDEKLKSGLRKALARGWLTSMRSMDGGLVRRIVEDMRKAGWGVTIETEEGPGGKERVVKAATFRDLTEKETAQADGLNALLEKLFTPGIVNDWLLPFINKGGQEVFKYAKEAIPQLTLQNAWANANGNVLAWIDGVAQTIDLGAAEEVTETVDGQQMTRMSNPLAEFRLSMLKQLDGLYGMESKIAAETGETRNMFDSMGPKPHVMMDARINDLIPQEHLNFLKFDRATANMLLAEIAFHAAFGRNGQMARDTFKEMNDRAQRAKVDYSALQATSPGGRAAEALARGWKDYKALENLAKLADQIVKFQLKFEAFLGTKQAGGPFDNSRKLMAVLNFMQGMIVDNPATALYNVINLAGGPSAKRSLGPAALRAVGDNVVATMKTGLGSILEAFNVHLLHASEPGNELAQTMGKSRNLPWNTTLADMGPGGNQSNWERYMIRPLNSIGYAQRKGVGIPFQAQAKEFPRLAVVPGLGVANFVSQVAAVGGLTGETKQFERMLLRGVEYFASHRDAVTDPAFRFKAKDLGLRFDQGVFEWWKTNVVEFNMGSLEDIVRATVPAAQEGGRIVTAAQASTIAEMLASQINGDSSISTLPSLLVTTPILRSIFPLLRWPFWAMHKAYGNLASMDGKRDFRTVARGLAILAMWNLPVGLAFTFMIDWYDDELLGKKKNLPTIGGVAALPFVGPAIEAMMADRSIPASVKAYLVRGARAGNLGGVAGDAIAYFAQPSDAQSGRRTISLDQRILVFSQLMNIQRAVTDAVSQETLGWASFWNPIFRSIGGNGALHMLDISNNLLGLDNAQSRNVMRQNAGNWLRASASELGIPLRPGGSGTATPMSAQTREMYLSAISNDKIGFQVSYVKALEEARKTVSSDPSVSARDREHEAEKRVLQSWRSRNPLAIFAHEPTAMEVRRMLGIMDPDGAQDVRDALNRFQSFTRAIAPTPQETQQRAQIRRLTTPTTASNPFRRQVAQPVY